jgi:hypothetical protein
MKLTPQEQKIMARMQPGVITLNGFLGDDERHLHEIIETDARALEALDLTSEEVASRMKYFTDMSFNEFNEEVLIDDHYLVSTDVVRGKLPCPFAHPGVYRKAITTLLNRKNGIQVRWTSLSIHMIERHGFFEGLGSPFRLEPRELCKALFE